MIETKGRGGRNRDGNSSWHNKNRALPRLHLYNWLLLSKDICGSPRGSSGHPLLPSLHFGRPRAGRPPLLVELAARPQPLPAEALTPADGPAARVLRGVLSPLRGPAPVQRETRAHSVLCHTGEEALPWTSPQSPVLPSSYLAILGSDASSSCPRVRETERALARSCARPSLCVRRGRRPAIASRLWGVMRAHETALPKYGPFSSFVALHSINLPQHRTVAAGADTEVGSHISGHSVAINPSIHE